MEIKYEAVFGDYEMFDRNNAPDDCEIIGDCCYKIIDGVIKVWNFSEKKWVNHYKNSFLCLAMRRIIRTQDQHSDDINVDDFAKDMKVKLEHSRNNGRSGWETCPIEFLVSELKRHVDKGDPVDVANFAMMIHQRGERISNPAWSKADQDAGRLPEVGALFSYKNEMLTCHYIDSNGEIWANNFKGEVVTPLLREISPLESPEEKAARLRMEWCNEAGVVCSLGMTTLTRIYDAMLSGDLPVPVKGE